MGLVLDQAIRLVYEVRSVSGREHWLTSLDTLKRHYDSGEFQSGKARELIRRHVRKAKQVLMSSADTPAIELATDALLVETMAAFMKDKRECRHPRKQRQVDEYYCPACNKRWEVNEDEEDI